MTEPGIIELREKVRGLEEDVRDIRNLAQAVGENTATLRVLLSTHQDLAKEIVKLRDDFDERFQNMQTMTMHSRSNTSVKTLVQFAATIMVPILLALIGGYFALKGAQVPNGR